MTTPLDSLHPTSDVGVGATEPPPSPTSPCCKENNPPPSSYCSSSNNNNPTTPNSNHTNNSLQQLRIGHHKATMGFLQSAHSPAELCATGIEDSKGVFTQDSSEVKDYINNNRSSGIQSSSLPASTSDQTLIADDDSTEEPTKQQHDPSLSNTNTDNNNANTSCTTGPPASSPVGGPRLLFKRVRNKFSLVVNLAGNVAGQKVKQVEEYMFPHAPQIGAAARHNRHPQTITTRVRGGVLLRGCLCDEEHRAYTREIVDKLRPLNGSEGLSVVGLEYRQVPIIGNKNEGQDESDDSNDDDDDDGESTTSCGASSHGDDRVNSKADEPEQNGTTDAVNTADDESSSSPSKFFTRLFHVETNTMITNENRKLFIADGDMYDAVARLCQEAAQNVMIQEGGLEWVTVCEAGANAEDTRALVSKDISSDESTLDAKPTLLIATGKGKVRAGIFSRQHLMTSGMECSTALPIVREAVKRAMNIVMVDPNVHGERLGMIAFEKSMARIFRRWEQSDPSSSSPHLSQSTLPSTIPTLESPQSPDLEPTSTLEPPLVNRDLFVLSHSQSGAQLARYLLDKSEHYLPHIRAVAFTDSTHNIQWSRNNEGLDTLLQSPKSVYFKCSDENNPPSKEINDTNTNPTTETAPAPLESVGVEINTDSFWEYRFGKIKTLCAGTTEHSLTNWTAHSHIWEHFDSHLEQVESQKGRQ